MKPGTGGSLESKCNISIYVWCIHFIHVLKSHKLLHSTSSAAAAVALAKPLHSRMTFCGFMTYVTIQPHKTDSRSQTSPHLVVIRGNNIPVATNKLFAAGGRYSLLWTKATPLESHCNVHLIHARPKVTFTLKQT